MTKINQPLAEVFGHDPKDFSDRAVRYRRRKLCPFNNKVPSCTKDKAADPLGVCSVVYDGIPVATCPTRFREDWLITDDAADFFFPADTSWTSLTEVKLKDYYGKSAGNIDVVLAAYDEKGKVYDFGSLEIQAVYISGNVREPFAHYMSDCEANADMNWPGPNYPRPDFLSSSRKRLAPQMLYKGGILHEWDRKMAVALDTSFYKTLPKLPEVKKEDAEVAWLIYDFVPKPDGLGYNLQRSKVIYTKFIDSLNIITRPRVGDINKFIGELQTKVDAKLKAAPITKTIDSPF